MEMIKINNIEVSNFEGAFRGMRNPMNSWEKSDSYFGISSSEEDELYDQENMAFEIITKYLDPDKRKMIDGLNYHSFDIDSRFDKWLENYNGNDEEQKEERDSLILYKDVKEKAKILFEQGFSLPNYNDCFHYAYLGPNDLTLAQKLISGGPVHSKFMRQIFVSMDIDAPLYWWKEMDTYKVGTTANSCSTMHKIHSNNIDKNLFSLDNSYSLNEYENEVIDRYLHLLEDLRVKSNNNDKEAWRLLIQLLPESWNQKRTWTADYETLRNIYQWRRNHKLNEWHDFCQMIEELPYGKELICYNIGGNNSEA